MGKLSVTDEVQVLRFFEAGPIEKAEAVFNIVAEKMRERLRGPNRDDDGTHPGARRKRNTRENQNADVEESNEPNPRT